MVKVPTQTQSEVQLQPTPIPQGAMGNLGKEVQNLSEGIGSLADHFQKVQDFSEKKKAEALLAESYNNRIYKMATSDPDLRNLPQKISEATDSIIDDSSKVIASPEIRNNFIEDSKRQIDLKDTHIQSIIAQRQIKDARTSLYTSIDSDIDEAHKLPPGQLHDIKVKNIQSSLDEAEGLGLISPEQNKRLGETQFNKMSVDQVYHDLDLAEHGGIHSDSQFSTKRNIDSFLICPASASFNNLTIDCLVLTLSHEPNIPSAIRPNAFKSS